MSRVAEETATRADKAKRNRRRAEENRAALDACAREVGREGLALARHRPL